MRLVTLRAILFLTILPGCVAGLAAGQSTEADIAARLVDKPVMLRGFWGDDKLKFDFTGQAVGRYMPVSFTICGMDVMKVTLRGSSLRLEGQRVGLTWDKDGRMSRVPLTTGDFRKHSPEKISVEIDGHGGGDYGPALGAVFADNLGVLVPAMPPYWQRYARAHFLPNSMSPDAPIFAEKPVRKTESETEADKNQPVASADRSVLRVGGSVKPPRVLKMTEAEFSDEARQVKYSGNTQVYLWVDQEGVPSHVQIARPTGLGLDEQAVRAVSSYTFIPAVKDNKAVRVELYVEVNFQIF